MVSRANLVAIETEPSRLVLRRYRAEDNDAVRELHDVALRAVGALGGPGPWDDDLSRIPEVYLDGRGEFLVGLLQGQIVAMGALRWYDQVTAEVKRMRVHPRVQRRGYGRMMLSRLEERALELGYRRLLLDTTERQLPAIGLYRSAGYVETGRTPVAGMPGIVFAKSLAQGR